MSNNTFTLDNVKAAAEKRYGGKVFVNPKTEQEFRVRHIMRLNKDERREYRANEKRIAEAGSFSGGDEDDLDFDPFEELENAMRDQGVLLADKKSEAKAFLSDMTLDQLVAFFDIVNDRVDGAEDEVGEA